MKKDNKIKKRIFLLSFTLFFLLLFSLNSIFAQQNIIRQINLEFDKGLIILYSPQQYLTQYEDYTINFFVYNKTSGVELDNSSTNCTFYFADDKGNLIYSDNVGYYNNYWQETINKENFTRLGEYNYGIKCIKGSIGGVAVGTYQVTPSGQSGNENTVFFILVITIIYGINLISFFGRNIPMTILGGMAMLFLGVYLVSQGIIIYRDNITNYIAYLTIAIGAITSMWAVFEQLEVI